MRTLSSSVKVRTACQWGSWTILKMTMSEYGATAAMFYIDQNTIDYLTLTGREAEQVALVENYAKEIGLWASDMKQSGISTCTFALIFNGNT